MLNQDKLLRFARPELQDLAEKTGYNTNIGVLHEGQVLYVYRLDAPGTRYTHSMLGRLAPIHCTALGKVLMSELPREEAEKILAARGMPKYTEKTLQAPDALHEELERVAARGYAVDRQETNEDICCVAAPVRNNGGCIVAAVSVSILTAEVMDSDEEAIAQTVLYHTKCISSAMGCQRHYL